MVPTAKAHWETHHLPQIPSQALPIPGMPWLTSRGCRAGNGLSHVHFLCVLCSAAVCEGHPDHSAKLWPALDP